MSETVSATPQLAVVPEQTTTHCPETPAITLVESSAPGGDKRQEKTLAELIRLSIGFAGITFGASIQLGQLSPLLESLGSDPRLTALIWCAGPVAGVVLLPLSGILSDMSTSRWGRRRPYLLCGGVMMAIALALMPHVPVLWLAALLLWGIEGGNNFMQGAYRPLVPDNIAPKQHALAFSMIAFALGFGYMTGFIAGFLIPDRTALFTLGALVLLGCLAVTLFTTPESPCQHEVDRQPERPTPVQFVRNQLAQIAQLPPEAKRLCFANSFTWFAICTMFVFFSVYVPHHLFNAHSPADPMYQKGVQWASLGYAVLNGSCFVFSMFISRLCNRYTQKSVHTFGLMCLATGFSLLPFIHNQYLLLGAAALMGIGWATTLSLPYAMFSQYLTPGREGMMMGVFNLFLSGPGLLSGLIVGQLVMAFGNNVAVAMTIAGLSVFVSAVLYHTAGQQKHELQIVPPNSPVSPLRKAA